jgi:hypothetical protein
VLLSLLLEKVRLSDVVLSFGALFFGFVIFSKEQAGSVAMWASRSKSLSKS